MILVTGATGLSGSAVIREFARQQTPGRALRRVYRILLISSADQQMVEAQYTFIDAAKKAGVRHIVKFSGLGAALGSPFLFTQMHAESERYLEGSGLGWTHLRPSQFMQVYLREVPSI